MVGRPIGIQPQIYLHLNQASERERERERERPKHQRLTNGQHNSTEALRVTYHRLKALADDGDIVDSEGRFL